VIDRLSFGARPHVDGVLLPSAVSAGIGLLAILASVDQPALAPAVLLLGGFLVGLGPGEAWWSSTGSAAVGIALAGWLHPGIVAGRDGSAAVLLAVGAVMSLLLFVPAWCFGRATGARRRAHGGEERHGDASAKNATATRAPTNYAAVGLTIAIITVVVFAGYVVLITRGGGCCP
jgi:hypothetical protein